MTDIVTTERLVLRRFRSSDAAAIVSGIGDFDVAQWLTNVPFPYSLADAGAFMDRLGEDDLDAFAVEHEGRLIGCVSIGKELGYWYAKDVWGRGFATEAGHAMACRHFANDDAPLLSGYHLGNSGSCNVLTKLGSTPTLRRTARSLSRGQDVEVPRMALTSADWQARK